MPDNDVSFYYQNTRYESKRPIPVKEIEVDYTKDSDPERPIATMHEIMVRNDTDHRLTELKISTNLPDRIVNRNGQNVPVCELVEVPTSIPPRSSRSVVMAVYGRSILEAKREDLPSKQEGIKLSVLYKEVEEWR